MRVIVIVVLRINVRIYLKVEDSVAVQSKRREISECPVYIWQVSVPKPRAGKGWQPEERAS